MTRVATPNRARVLLRRCGEERVDGYGFPDSFGLSSRQ